jgi:hypothetical protein
LETRKAFISVTLRNKLVKQLGCAPTFASTHPRFDHDSSLWAFAIITAEVRIAFDALNAVAAIAAHTFTFIL